MTLSMVAVRHSGEEMSTNQSGESNGRCFDDTDCFNVKWGSTEQNQAELAGGWHERGISDSLVTKAANLLVTFEVAGNATNANLYVSGRKIPADLQGNTDPGRTACGTAARSCAA